MKLAVYIVEDEPSIQDSLKVVIEGYLRAEVIGTAPSEAEAVAWLHANDGWRLLVVDLKLAQGSGPGRARGHCRRGAGAGKGRAAWWWR
jgi:DNA-binding NarL/FixJ family response regulator